MAGSYTLSNPVPLTVDKGGTGQVTLTAHSILLGEGTSAISALGAATNGQLIIGSTGVDPVLAAPTNGNNITWTLGAGSVKADVSGTTNHSILLGNNSGNIANLGAATNGQIPIGSTGADPVLAIPSNGNNITFTGGAGSLTANLTGTTNHTVQVGNSSGSLTSLGAGLTGQVLTGVTGGDPSFQSPAASSISITGDLGGTLTSSSFTFTGGTTGMIFTGSGSTETVSGTLIVGNGGTGAATLTGVLIGNGTSAVTGNAITQHDVLVGGASNAITSVAPSATSGVPLISGGSSANPSFGTALVAGGGTGAVTLTGVLTGNGTSAVTANTVTQHGVLLGGATNAVSSLGVGSTGQVLTGVTGTDPSWQSPAASSITITGDSGGALTGAAFTFTGASTGLTFAGSGTTETIGGTLVVSNGGTGAATLTGVLIGNGTSAVTGNAITQYDVLVGGASNAITSVAPSATSGVPLISGGSSANPSFGTAVVAGGGTGAVTLTGVLIGNGTSAVTGNAVTQHDVLIGGASNAINSITNGTTGQVLLANTGADPAWGTAPASTGGWTLIQTLNASSSASLAFTTGVTGYNTYAFVVTQLVPATNNEAVNLVISSNGGSSYIVTGYQTGYLSWTYNSTTWTNGNSTTVFLNTPAIGNGGLQSCSMVIYVNSTSSSYCNLWGTGAYGNIKFNLSGVYTTAFLINAFKWTFASGNITSGTISLYGIQ